MPIRTTRRAERTKETSLGGGRGGLERFMLGGDFAAMGTMGCLKRLM
jgi:hypothetical protein